MPATSPDNLTYPDASGGTSLWQHVQNLATSAQAKFAAMEAWNAWTPTFDTPGNGGITSVGAGAIGGHYNQRGKHVHAEFRFQLGAGFAIQSGTFVLMLPVPAFVWGGNGLNAAVGSWILRDDSTSPVQHMAGTLGLFQVSSDRVHFGGAPIAGGGASVRRMDSTDPITWAASDILSGFLDYRAA